jgi:hypothetical protein
MQTTMQARAADGPTGAPSEQRPTMPERTYARWIGAAFLVRFLVYGGGLPLGGFHPPVVTYRLGAGQAAAPVGVAS